MLSHLSKYSGRPSILALALLSGCATDHHVRTLVLFETYQSSPADSHLDQLPNAEENAGRVSKALASLSTAQKPDPTSSQPLTREVWQSKTTRFTSTLTDKDYAVVYISAHGAVNSAGDIELFDTGGGAFPVTDELQAIMNKASASVFFLDICREADKASVHSSSSGVRLVGSNGTILFSTDLGRDAGDASIFSKQIEHEITKRQELRVTLRNIMKNVIEQSGRTSNPDLRQHPWTYGLIPSDIYLAGPPPKPGTGP